MTGQGDSPTSLWVSLEVDLLLVQLEMDSAPADRVTAEIWRQTKSKLGTHRNCEGGVWWMKHSSLRVTCYMEIVYWYTFAPLLMLKCCRVTISVQSHWLNTPDHVLCQALQARPTCTQWSNVGGCFYSWWTYPVYVCVMTVSHFTHNLAHSPNPIMKRKGFWTVWSISFLLVSDDFSTSMFFRAFIKFCFL